jgi:hypothetical protein
VIANLVHASERGIRILCDYLTIIGLLAKSGDTYGLTPESAAFLSNRSASSAICRCCASAASSAVNAAARSCPSIPTENPARVRLAVEWPI